MFHPQSRFRSLAILFCAIVLSGLPLPILDAHPTNSTEVSNHPSLLVHLQKAPASEHQGVDDSEVHIHWVSILLFNDGLSQDIRTEQLHELLGIPQTSADESHACILVLQWDIPRFLTVLSHRSSPALISPSRASEDRSPRLLI